jgi:hypothetical protein
VLAHPRDRSDAQNCQLLACGRWQLALSKRCPSVGRRSRTEHRPERRPNRIELTRQIDCEDISPTAAELVQRRSPSSWPPRSIRSGLPGETCTSESAGQARITSLSAADCSLATFEHCTYVVSPVGGTFQHLEDPKGTRPFEEYQSRVHQHLRRLDAIGANYRPVEGPTPGQSRVWLQG